MRCTVDRVFSINLVVVVLLGLTAPGLVSLSSKNPPDLAGHAQEHVLVRLEIGADAAHTVGTGTQRVFDRWYRVPLPANSDVQEAVASLASRPGVELAEPDYLFKLDPQVTAGALDHSPGVVVDDPLSSYQWHFPAVQLDTAWAESTGAGVVVAVVDSGVSKGGEDLDCHTFVSPYNAITGTSGSGAVADDHGHGTHVAGTVAQCTDNGIGVAGVAFDASLMPVKVLDERGEGFASWIANGIDWARVNGADVINLSLGGSYSSIMADAIDAAVDDGVVVVAASGNSNSNSVSFPARQPGVIAVGATDFGNQLAPYSNRGSALDLVAPGGDLGQDANEDSYGDGVLQETFTTQFGWGYYFFNGTSMATPHVSGAAALLLAIEPDLGPVGVESILESTALDLGAPGFDNSYGHGLVQIHDALVQLASPDTTAPNWPESANVSVSEVTGTTVELAWPEASDDQSVTGYRIYQDGDLVDEIASSATSTAITGLTPSTTYEFGVRAKDLAGNLSPALSVAVTTPDTIAPQWNEGAGMEVRTYGETQLTLSWRAATDNLGVTGYRVRLIGTTGILVSGTSTTVTGLQPGTLHLFEVLARDAAGNWSDPNTTAVRTSRSFTDTGGHVFYDDIVWMSGVDITRGCNPPSNDRFCPDDPVTRAQMAAFVVRALGLSENLHPGFVDVPGGSTFAEDVGRLATAGVTRGCNPPVNDRFCPDDPVTRGQLAAFLHRALG